MIFAARELRQFAHVRVRIHSRVVHALPLIPGILLPQLRFAPGGQSCLIFALSLLPELLSLVFGLLSKLVDRDLRVPELALDVLVLGREVVLAGGCHVFLTRRNSVAFLFLIAWYSGESLEGGRLGLLGHG